MGEVEKKMQAVIQAEKRVSRIAIKKRKTRTTADEGEWEAISGVKRKRRGWFVEEEKGV